MIDSWASLEQHHFVCWSTDSPVEAFALKRGFNHPDLSVVLDRNGHAWQKIYGEWVQGDVIHDWDYLLAHHGPLFTIWEGAMP